MKFSYSLVSFALIAGLGIGTALAQDAAGSSDAPAFSDLSHGGKYITRKDIPEDNERLKQLRSHMSENDVDHNGKIDEKEYNAYMSKDNPLNKKQ
ncbi:hypothetical protein C8J98_11717 [Luteibacter sp. OK325]|jgi:hypothetical protein|uniref:hypothetical protein n=1 Tax=Luteibacter sp. OK325 TaxID=2135670 RepID=UPI000D3BE015|nr:hypothetical protein [Luteibacter sp. OK325]PTR22126.1 hypothetical protein C8J98_11717 [Luteibacter sp. OK325]